MSEWSDGLPKTMSCDPEGIGSHNCGTQNGWILWHNGATYMDQSHPCAVSGSATPGAGDLTHLWVCLDKQPPPGPTVQPPNGGAPCDKWKAVWTENFDLQTLPSADQDIPRSANDLYFIANAAMTKGLYIYDPSPNWTGTHYWESNAPSGTVRCRSTAMSSWSDALPRTMSCTAR